MKYLWFEDGIYFMKKVENKKTLANLTTRCTEFRKFKFPTYNKAVAKD